MTTSPKDALEAAKLRRSENLQARQQQEAEQAAFPALAEQKLQEIDAKLKAETPKELRLETKLGPGGLMDRASDGRRGVKSIYLRVFEEQALVAEGSISVGSDQSVEIADHTVRNKSVPFKTTTFVNLDSDLSVEFLSHLITKHIA